MLFVVFELNLAHKSRLNIVEVDHLCSVSYRFNVLKIYANLRSNFYIFTRKSLSGRHSNVFYVVHTVHFLILLSLKTYKMH